MIEQFMPQEFCLKCQGCCRFREGESVWLPCILDSEIQELLKNNIPPLAISPEKRIRLIPSEKENNFTCIFFNLKDNKCKIYSFRPFECQLYPFLINRNLDKVFLAVDLRCLFVKDKTESKEFKGYVNNLSRILNSQSFRKTLKTNPQVIQAYPEVLNLIELKV